MLCGACADGLSVMLGTNECGECSWPSILLLLVFAVLCILLVVLLIILNLMVSVGSLCQHSRDRGRLLVSPRVCSSTESVHFLDQF